MAVTNTGKRIEEIEKPAYQEGDIVMIQKNNRFIGIDAKSQGFDFERQLEENKLFASETTECNMHRIIRKCLDEGRKVPEGLICFCGING